MNIHDILVRYASGLLELIRAYSSWVETQAKNKIDVLVLTLGPVFLLTLFFWSLPAWLIKTIAAILLVPILYVVYLFLRDRK